MTRLTPRPKRPQTVGGISLLPFIKPPKRPLKERKFKMFKSLGSAIYRWLRNSHEYYADNPRDNSERRTHVKSNELFMVSLYSANGGFILEVRHNDPKKDEYEYNLHIISDDQDFDKSMAQIIQLEMMKVR